MFTWQEWADELLALSPDAFDSHMELAEYQTDQNPTLYLASAAGVFLGFLLRLGFVPTLMLGRLCTFCCLPCWPRPPCAARRLGGGCLPQRRCCP